MTGENSVTVGWNLVFITAVDVLFIPADSVKELAVKILQVRDETDER